MKYHKIASTDFNLQEKFRNLADSNNYENVIRQFEKCHATKLEPVISYIC